MDAADIGAMFTESVKAGVLLVARGMAEGTEDDHPDLIYVLNKYVGDDIRDEVAEYIWLRFKEVSPWISRELIASDGVGASSAAPNAPTPEELMQTSEHARS